MIPEILEKDVVFFASIKAGKFNPDPIIVPIYKNERDIVLHDETGGNGDGVFKIFIMLHKTQKLIPLGLLGSTPEAAAAALLDKLSKDMQQEIDRYRNEREPF
jgi:hypothetical protein